MFGSAEAAECQMKLFKPFIHPKWLANVVPVNIKKKECTDLTLCGLKGPEESLSERGINYRFLIWYGHAHRE